MASAEPHFGLKEGMHSLGLGWLGGHLAWLGGHLSWLGGHIAWLGLLLLLGTSGIHFEMPINC